MNGIIKDILGLPFSWRQRRLAKHRRALKQSEFVQQITSQGGDGPTAESLWERLKDCIYTDAFTPYPTDDLQAIFGITDEELDEDLVLAILREEKVSIPTEEILSDFGPTWTPLQVALLVKRCRRVDAGQI
jgi:hypothetical protein